MAKKHRTKSERIAIAATFSALSYFLLQFLLPEFVPAISEEHARQFVEWFGNKVSYRAIILSPILVTLLIACGIYSVQFIRLHREKEDGVETNPTISSETSLESVSPSREDGKNLQTKYNPLEHLSLDEKDFLSLFTIINDTKCLTMEPNIIAKVLSQQNILHRPNYRDEEFSLRLDTKVTYCLQDWVWIHLKEHPELLR